MERNRENAIEIGKRIRSLRKSHYMTLEDLAKHIDASSKSTVSNWEQGISAPSLRFIQLLSKVFNVSESWILSGEDMIAIQVKAKTAKLALEWLVGGSAEYNLEYKPEFIEASYDLYKAIKETGTDVDIPANLNEEDLEDEQRS